jgi:hypothetical protein
MLSVIIPIAVSRQIAEGCRAQGRSRARSSKCKLRGDGDYGAHRQNEMICVRWAL